MLGTDELTDRYYLHIRPSSFLERIKMGSYQAVVLFNFMTVREFKRYKIKLENCYVPLTGSSLLSCRLMSLLK